MLENFAVIGGGFYGLRIALHLRETRVARAVVVLEREREVMTRASYVNQARVHLGYHYPRSVLTAYRSRINYPNFAREFPDAIEGGFPHYYGIARVLSKTNGRQFAEFCRRIGAPSTSVSPEVMQLFNPARIERVFEVREPAFDSTILREVILDRLRRVGGIEVRTGWTAQRIEQAGSKVAVVGAGTRLLADHVIAAVYSGTNALSAASGLPTVGLQHELTELALVELPEPLKQTAFTVMDGPFFSMMPFPPEGLHSLSHVRYTVHHRWSEGARGLADDPDAKVAQLPRRTMVERMKADVNRFLQVGEIRHDHSLFEVKTVLSRSSDDDSRPILFHQDRGITGFTSIMGSKLDNIYDVLTELDRAHVR